MKLSINNKFYKLFSLFKLLNLELIRQIINNNNYIKKANF
jgi:hypothetical protein